MKVSVVIPAWRAERFIGAAIASARAQTLSDIEILVVNDCSPDGTLSAAERAAGGDPRVRIFSLAENQGPAGARNHGFAAAQGEWIAVLDADDTMAPERLERLLAFAERQGLDIAADDLRIVNQAGQPAGAHLRLRQPLKLDLAAFAAGNRMFSRRPDTGYLKPLFRAAFVRRVALAYDPRVRIGEDYVILAEALALGAVYAVLPEALYNYTIRGGSISSRLRGTDIAMLIAADDRFNARFGAGLSPAARAAAAARRASLEDAAAFVRAVEALKARDPGGALGALARRPAALRHFSMPIGARLRRAFGFAQRDAS